MDNLKDILLNKWASDQLAHFYILQAPTSCKSPDTFLETWVRDYVSTIVSREKNISLDHSKELLNSGHADVLFIKKENKDDKQKDYSIADGDFNEFFRFLGHRNFELKRRFIIVSDAHLVNKTMANKLLKTLEEPPEGTTIFFLRPIKKALLSTISSRAITLSIKSNEDLNKISVNYREYEKALNNVLQDYGLKQDEALELSSYFKDFASPAFLITPLIDALKTKKSWQNSLYNSLIELSSELPLKFKDKSEILEKIKWFEKSKTFNNSMNERMTNLVMTLHNATMSLDKSKQN